MTESQKPDFFQDKQQQKPQTQNKTKQYVFLSLVIIGYLVLFAVIGRMFAISADNIIFSLSLYLYGLIGGFAVILMKSLFNNKEMEQRMLAEILEESHSSRLITDADLNTVYHNSKFKNLVQADSDIARIEDFYMLFENSQKTKRQIQALLKSLDQTGYEQAEFTFQKNAQELILNVQVQAAHSHT